MKRILGGMMKKRAVSLALIVMILCLPFAALAEDSLRLFFDSATDLLLNTRNVTLNGHAEFSLDGERFKTAELCYVQDDTNSLLQLNLRTPRRNGSSKPDRESGYTVIANGENVYVMEVIYPGVYKTGSGYAQSTVLRNTVQMHLMTDVIRMLAAQADTLPGTDAVTVRPGAAGGKELRIQLGEDVPDLVNTALNLVYQFAAKRYFGMDYDQLSEWAMGPMDNAVTVMQGILWNTKSISLKQADISAVRDDAGRLEQVKGAVALYLNTGRDGTRQLDLSFRLDASDFGGSRVDRFDPEAYGVRLADGYSLPETAVEAVPEKDT